MLDIRNWIPLKGESKYLDCDKKNSKRLMVVMNILISIEKFLLDNLQLFLQKLSVKTSIFKRKFPYFLSKYVDIFSILFIKQQQQVF